MHTVEASLLSAHDVEQRYARYLPTAAERDELLNDARINSAWANVQTATGERPTLFLLLPEDLRDELAELLCIRPTFVRVARDVFRDCDTTMKMESATLTLFVAADCSADVLSLASGSREFDLVFICGETVLVAAHVLTEDVPEGNPEVSGAGV